MENRWICVTPRSCLKHTILYKLFPQHLSMFDSTDFIYYLGIAIER